MTIGTFFLTEIDPRLQIVGSRDALGGQAVWASLGRRVVANLTLASNDIAGFRTLLIGYGLAGDEPEGAARLDLFLRWEQVAAGARVAVNDPSPPLGARAVRRVLAERERMPIGREHQILGDQRNSGLWLLYHRAARDSGLVDDRRRLTELGGALFEMWQPFLPNHLLRKVGRADTQQVRFGKMGSPTDDSRQIASCLVDGVVGDRVPLLDALVRGLRRNADGTVTQLADGVQERFAALLRRQRRLPSWRERLSDLVQQAGDDHVLAHRLRDILITESVLYPIQAAFEFLLVSGNGATIDDIGKRIPTAWPKVAATVRAEEFRDHVQPVLLRALGPRRAGLWVDAGAAMAAGDWPRALDIGVQINADAMMRRGGAPWVRTAPSKTLDVRLPTGAPLPEQEDVLNGWRNPYYLDPVLTVQRDLVGSSRL